MKRLQNRLSELGYFFGDVDGKFGPETASAVRYFQSVNGLEVNGIADFRTIDYIYSDDAVMDPAPTPTPMAQGVQGDDVTLNALPIADIPETLDAKKLKIDPSEIPQGTFEVRGEVYMEREAFERLNEQFILEGKKIFQNPRNTVSGSLKLKSVAECKTRPMRFFAYHIPQSNNATH